LADRHVEEGEQHAARQREIVAAFQRDGHDTKEAHDIIC
jgi:hypothetical protein